MTPGLGIGPGTHWWEAGALTTALSLMLPYLIGDFQIPRPHQHAKRA